MSNPLAKLALHLLLLLLATTALSVSNDVAAADRVRIGLPPRTSDICRFSSVSAPATSPRKVSIRSG